MSILRGPCTEEEMVLAGYRAQLRATFAPEMSREIERLRDCIRNLRPIERHNEETDERWLDCPVCLRSTCAPGCLRAELTKGKENAGR